VTPRDAAAAAPGEARSASLDLIHRSNCSNPRQCSLCGRFVAAKEVCDSEYSEVKPEGWIERIRRRYFDLAGGADVRST
jgi:hypothetical protein